MRNRLLFVMAFAAVSFLSSTPALAAEGAVKPPARPDPAAACAQEAKSLKGEERDRFIAKCGERRSTLAASEAKPASQQERMKSCNAEARRKDLHGDERRSFMSACLRG